jgi:hypothetical protein
VRVTAAADWRGVRHQARAHAGVANSGQK